MSPPNRPVPRTMRAQSIPAIFVYFRRIPPSGFCVQPAAPARKCLACPLLSLPSQACFFKPFLRPCADAGEQSRLTAEREYKKQRPDLLSGLCAVMKTDRKNQCFGGSPDSLSMPETFMLRGMKISTVQ